MMGVLPTASLPWLIAHELRVRIRSRRASRIAQLAILVLSLLPLTAGLLLAWRWQAAPTVPIRSIGAVAAALAAMALVMISSAFAHVLRALRDQSGLELLLSAPVPPARVLGARSAAIHAVVALPFLVLTLPFFLFSAVLGHPTWLAGILVVLLVAMTTTSLAWLLATLLDRLLGQRRASLVAQVTGVVLGAGAFGLGQAPNFAPVWFQAQLDRLQTPPPPPLSWPALALFGQPVPLLGMTALALLLAWAASHVAGGAAEAMPAVIGQDSHRAPTFRTGAARVIIGKELRLLRRDPELISQIGQQLVFMVPVLALIFSGGDITPARMASAGVFAAGALASSLAWLIVCGEDAPDLVGAAPVPPVLVARAKLAAALTPPMALVGLLALAVAWRDPAVALALLPMSLIAGCGTALMQAWNARPQPRSAFRSRNRSSLLLAVAEFIMLGCWAAATGLLLSGSSWALVPAGVSAVIVGGAFLLRQR